MRRFAQRYLACEPVCRLFGRWLGARNDQAIGFKANCDQATPANPPGRHGDPVGHNGNNVFMDFPLGSSTNTTEGVPGVAAAVPPALVVQ